MIAIGTVTTSEGRRTVEKCRNLPQNQAHRERVLDELRHFYGWTSIKIIH